MKQLLIISLSCLLICISISGQNKIKTISTVQKSVNLIDSIVKKVTADTSIELQTVISAEEYEITSWYENRKLVILKKMYNGLNFFNNNSHSYYFENGKPVLYIEQYSNNSRMGSCGEISVSFFHYLQDSIAFAGLAKSAVHFYTCYGYKLSRPNIKKIFAEIDTLKNEFKIGRYEKTVKEKLQGPFIHFYLNRSEEIQDQYGF